MKIKEELEDKLRVIISELVKQDLKPEITIPNDLIKGDFSSNIAMRLAGKLGSPMEAGEKIIEKLRQDSEFYSKFSKIELINPGFINFHLSHMVVSEAVIFATRGFKPKRMESSMIMEFGDLNPFKEPHIGHVRMLVLGEALCRLLEFTGVRIVRANYEGDVGMHVAKCIWGIRKSAEFEKMINESLEVRARYLGKCYSSGAKAFEENKAYKDEIIQINTQVYQKDPQIMEIWEKGRQWSLEYFEELYERVGVKYEKYYFESEIAEHGKKLVLENPDIFPKDNGAFVFRGEEFGLHTRVFINNIGNPTYEAKDLGLAFAKNDDYPSIDKSMIMTANEQVEYFKVLLKALGEINREIAGKTTHLSMGFVDLKDGKMSSRSGNVISGFWLLNETKNRLKEGFKDVSNDVAEELTVGAVKWSMLKFSRESNIKFSIEESIDLAGNSGPYIQYTFARICSILNKTDKKDFEAKSVKNYPPDLLALGRLICQFESVIKNSVDHFSPNYLTEYLFALAQKFNSLYEKEKIIGSVNESEKLTVLIAVKNVIEQGMRLLGIDTPEKI